MRVGDTLYADDGYRVFAVSADDGRLLWTSARAQRGSLVGILTIAATRTTVYIGGYLTVVGKSPLHQLAALDARTGRLLPWRPPQLRLYPGSAPVVTRLALSPRRLYVGGSFTSVGGVARKDGIAAFRLAGRRLTGFAPRSTVWNISALTAAGKLVLIGGPEGGGAFDARTSARRPGLEPLPSASAIAVRGRVAYLGGDLRTTIGGDNLLALDLATGKLKSWFPKLARYVSVGTIVPAGDRAFVGGQFCSTLG